MKAYLSICPPELSEQDTANVIAMLKRYGSFVYWSEKQEMELGLQEREQRSMVRLQNGSSYVGEWRKGVKNIREGKGV